MSKTATELIEAAYRLEEIDLADLPQKQLDRLATVPSIINAHCAFEAARRARSGGDAR